MLAVGSKSRGAGTARLWRYNFFANPVNCLRIKRSASVHS
jgi:hypothetical protein